MPLRLHKKALIIKLLLSSLFTLLTGCGVKGDPVPPDKPADLGRGQPTYRKAVEKIPLQNYSPADDEEKKEEPEDE